MITLINYYLFPLDQVLTIVLLTAPLHPMRMFQPATPMIGLSKTITPITIMDKLNPEMVTKLLDPIMSFYPMVAPKP